VCLAEQRLLLQRSSAKATVNSARLRAQSQSRRQKAHRTVNNDCPVHHWTVRGPSCQKLQRSNPNGWVTWLGPPARCGGPPPTVGLRGWRPGQCRGRPSTAAFPNGHFSGWGYKYPQPPTLQGSKFSANTFNTRASAFNTRHK
jgi:hypothetical protein